MTPAPPTIPDYCPAHSRSCQRILENIVNFSISIELKEDHVNDFCSSVCVDLAQQTPECFGTSEFRARIDRNVLCARRTDGQLCGAVIHNTEQISTFISNISRDCANPEGVRGINCTTNSSCVHSYQVYFDHLGCCSGTIVEDSPVNISQVVPCVQDLQIPPPCPGEQACSKSTELCKSVY